MATPPGTMPQLPNPFTPMAFLPPDLAFQTTIATYLIVGCLAVLIWDIINNLTGDYKLLFKHRITLPTVAYFASRLGSLAFILASAIFVTAPTGHCSTFTKVLDSFYPIAVPATSLLFFFRIRAIFDRNTYIVCIFFVLWLGVLGGSLTVPFALTGIDIGPTKYCLNASIKPYVAAAGILPLIHDTLVFIAITLRLMLNAHFEPSLKDGIRVVVWGDYLPAFSKALLLDGQMYYLVTVISNLLAVIMVYVTSVPVTYREMFANPNIMLMNIMACRVYRNTKFGLYRDVVVSTGTGNLKSKTADNQGTLIPLSFGRNPNMSRGGASTTFGVGSGVEVSKSVERTGDSDYIVSIDQKDTISMA